ncbi:MAG: XcyI family restriction endonuclease [bacterium]
MAPPSEKQIWSVDQIAKSEFFHQKLHEWELLEIADQLDKIMGEELAWNKAEIEISDGAWNKVIHRGIKPVMVFAHPQILRDVPCSTRYYRMLAMVSQKSMHRVGLSSKRHEDGCIPDYEASCAIAKHLNKIISNLVESDEKIDAREFDLWRGMAAGSQAQGSWQNAKGQKMELTIKGIIRRRLFEKGWVLAEIDDTPRVVLSDKRIAAFADEPDVGFYENDRIIAAVEIKGGIDTAGVLERLGAAIKSLRRAKEENPDSVTILILQGISMTQQSMVDLKTNREAVNYWFTIEEVLDDEDKRKEIFSLLRI